ncbi:MAG: cytochrome c3 family protein [Pseudomonadota bacterium]
MRRPVVVTMLVGMLTAAGIGLDLVSAADDDTGDGVQQSESPSPLIFPIQSLPFSFSHSRHLAGEQTKCQTCHVRADTSTRSTDRLFPGHRECSPCHHLALPSPQPNVTERRTVGSSSACRSCHSGNWEDDSPNALSAPPANLKFSHRIHSARRVECQRCHPNLASIGLATRMQLPKMSVCRGCHEQTADGTRCTSCHLAAAGGTIRVSFPQGLLVPSAALGIRHDLDYHSGHRRLTRSNERLCRGCHRREQCVRCHDSRLKPMALHPAGYVGLHQVEARRNDPDCSACHRLQSFCTGCHTRSGVSSDERTFGKQKGTPEQSTSTKKQGGSPLHRSSFHPEGWSSTDGKTNGRSPVLHARQARANIRSCVSCHREQSCAECHISVRPHPPGWERSSECRSLAKRNGRVCLRCHDSAFLATGCIGH